jgi:hypothetical protein
MESFFLPHGREKAEKRMALSNSHISSSRVYSTASDVTAKQPGKGFLNQHPDAFPQIPNAIPHRHLTWRICLCQLYLA